MVKVKDKNKPDRLSLNTNKYGIIKKTKTKDSNKYLKNVNDINDNNKFDKTFTTIKENPIKNEFKASYFVLIYNCHILFNLNLCTNI